jgi:hypothetical protein
VYRRYNRAAMILNKTSQEGLKDGWIRATFILRKDYLEKLKALAYWERKKIKQVVDEAFRLYLRRRKTRAKINN